VVRGVKVLFAAGGTGGHLYPAFAIAERLRARGDSIAFVGTSDRLESRLVPAQGYALFTIRAYPLSRRLSFDLVRTLVDNAVGFVQSLRILARERPDILVATGGYVCIPVVLAARARRIFLRSRVPVALLEPNVVPGFANRLLARRVDEIWGESNTGVPVRSALRHLPERSAAAGRLGLDPSKKTLLAFGGSQGARSINDALVALTANGGLPEGWQLLHVTGERDYERVRSARTSSVVRAYLDDPVDAYAVADLVLARAGASTIAELEAVGLPAILVPYPYAAEAHQQANANAAAARGAAVVVDDTALGARLGSLLREVCVPQRLAAMRASALGAGRDASSTVLARIDALIPRREASP
jgi:UDP-N-acetylglucosamine--N-acetylmuramyl-(pentapeptide) pyrophosphoryl-undecaprenol N-acetylglucosamine transferase